MTNDENVELLRVRLLLARAAQKDSLGWWEDDSLTPTGMYLLERLFADAPAEAGRKLALEAERVRYCAALGEAKDRQHLFHLDRGGEIEHGLRDIRLMEIPMPAGPIPNLDALRQELLNICGKPPKFEIVGNPANQTFEIRLPVTSLRPPVMDAVRALAWASLETPSNMPVFPYIAM